mmetsp:Transcript_57361/g.134488  ORF Transcript_57361/g.134488 Transcript_57361/m.134488 type:complete len:276 (-) Transcript_57361:126-953(-)
MGPFAYVFLVARSIIHDFVVRIIDVTCWLGSSQVADVQPPALLSRWVVWHWALNLERHYAVSSRTLVVELRGRDSLPRIGRHESLTEVFPRVQHLRLAPLDIHEAVTILLHAIFIVLLHGLWRHQVSHNVNNILEVLHANLPILLLFLEDLIREVRQYPPKIVRLVVFVPRIGTIWRIRSEDCEGLTRSRKPVGKHHNRISTHQVCLNFSANSLIHIWLTHHFHGVSIRLILSLDLLLILESTPPRIGESETRSVTHFVVEQVNLTSWRIHAVLN